MRICFILWPLVPGGLEVHAFSLAKSLRGSRYQPCFVFRSANPVLARGVPAPVTTFPLNGWHGIQAFARWLRENQIGLVHNLGYFTAGPEAALAAGIPSVWGIGGFRGHPQRSSPEDYELLKRMALLSPHVVVPSQALKRYFQRLSGFHVEQIPYGVETNRFLHPSPMGHDGSREVFRLSRKRTVVAMVGNFYRQKNHHDFLKTGALLCRQNPRLQLVIAGRCFHAPATFREASRRYLSSLKQQVCSLGLERRLRFVQFSDATRPAFFQAIDLLLSPSIEGFGLAMAEAMAAGKPVVSVDQGGSRDLIEHGISGYLTPEGNPRRMAQAALELLEDQPLARWIGKNAALRVRRLFSMSQQTQGILSLYDRILQSAPPYRSRR